jgi:hypothetical protein
VTLTAEQTETLGAINREADENKLTWLERVYAIATSWYESTLRGRTAIGDNGTSFGGYQHHAGGAGGPTVESARRYLDPNLSADERVKWFGSRDIDTGREAAELQRPADPSGYAAKVDAIARKILQTKALPDGTSLAGGAKAAAARPKWSPTLDQVLAIWQEEGIQKTSDNRSPAENAGANGVAGSHHIYDPNDESTWDTWAIDGVGRKDAMERARVRVSRLEGVLENMVHDAGSGLHHHVAGKSSSSSAGAGSSSSSSGSSSSSSGGADLITVGVKDAIEDGILWLGGSLVFVTVLGVGLLTGAALLTLGAVGATGQGDTAASAAKLAILKKGGGK